MNGNNKAMQARMFSELAGSEDDMFKPNKMRVTPAWPSTLDRVVKSTVSLHFSCPEPFDTESSYSSQATGFVVDAERGIIMTNRHVVGPGAFYGYAIFDNHEECTVHALYRDPVHDFGFLRFEPKDIKHMPVSQLELAPENAKVSTEIRVVGNDAGEKLSILSGIISRLDRNAPEYGELTYNDFNTEYIQAAASATGGSSGSPVVDITGKVVALQAGGSTTASTDFFLPLWRAQRALKCIQDGVPVTRGHFHVKWTLEPFDQCRRLGLNEEEEMRARQNNPDSIGMLVVESIVPGTQADELLEEADVILSVNGRPLCESKVLDDILDSNVGQTIELTVMSSGQRITHQIHVADLHEVTPSRYVKFGGAIVHDISYQNAQFLEISCQGVYLADIGYVFSPGQQRSGWLLEEFNGHEIRTLDEFIEVAKSIPNRKRVLNRYRHLSDLNQVESSVDYIDLSYSPKITLMTRNDQTGLWDKTVLAERLPEIYAEPAKAMYPPDDSFGPAIAGIARSFVRVTAQTPASIEGYSPISYPHYGLIIDAERGLIMCSRSVVPHFLCDLSLYFGESVVVPGKVVFLHPQHNYAIVQFDPKLVDGDFKDSGLLNNDVPKLQPGEELTFFGYRTPIAPVTRKSTVNDITNISLPLSPDSSGRYRATNFESVGFDTSSIQDCGSGVFVDDKGRVRAWWTVFAAGERIFRASLDASALRQGLLSAVQNKPVRFVDVEASHVTPALARVQGVDERWLEMAQAHNPARPLLVATTRCAAGVRGRLRENDIILSIDGEFVHSVLQLVNLDKDRVILTIIRNGRESQVEVNTTSSESIDIHDLVNWCGLTVHKPHHAVLQQAQLLPSMVYIASVAKGSPGEAYGMCESLFITHVGDSKVQTLEEFYETVKSIPDNTYVKIRTVTYDGQHFASSLKTNYHYFETTRKSF